MLALESVTKYYGAELVLRDVSVSIGGQTRLGVVGPNGIGKSTLLRIAAGHESPDAGQVVRDARARVGYLPQELPASNRSLDVRDLIKKRTGIATVEAELQRLLAALEAEKDESRLLRLSSRQAAVLDFWTSLGGPDLDARTLALFDSWNLPHELAAKPVGALSGGELARVNLCAIVQALQGFDGTLVVVSHDRRFLRNLRLQAIWRLEGGSMAPAPLPEAWHE